MLSEDGCFPSLLSCFVSEFESDLPVGLLADKVSRGSGSLRIDCFDIDLVVYALTVARLLRSRHSQSIEFEIRVRRILLKLQY